MSHRRTVVWLLAWTLGLAACGGDYSSTDGGAGGLTTGGTTTGTPTGGSTGGDSGDPALVNGQRLYDAQCRSCHGASGQGGLGPALGEGRASCPSCASQSTLETRIRDTMPSTNPGSCTGSCARDIAAYILANFSTGGGSTGGTTTGGTTTGGSAGGTTTGGSVGGTTTGGGTGGTPPPEPTCAIDFVYSSNWNTGFVADVTIRNFSGADASSWKVTWAFPNDQRVTNAWNTTISQAGAEIEALPKDYNRVIPNNGSVTFGMQGTHGGVNELPPRFTLDAPGCVLAGGDGGGTTGGSTGGTTTGGTTGGGSCATEPPPAPRLLRLLTRWEYQRTVRDLVGIDGDFARNLPVEPRVLGYDNNARVSVVSSRHVDEYLAAAQEVAARAVAERKSALLPCTPTASNQAACTAQFVDSFGRRALRRPLTAAERDQYVALMRDDLTGGSFDRGMEVIIGAMLVSPAFLYRSEAGDAGGGVYRLSAYETASSLSFLLWGSMPDDALLNAAASGALATAAGRETQARRLLQDPRAREQMAHFAAQWLGTDFLLGSFKDPDIFPRFTDEVRRSMAEELARFVNHVVFDAPGHSLNELLLADYVYVNGPLREFYRLPGSTTDPAFQQQPVSGGVRGGLLSLGAVLASLAHSNESSPIRRGVMVRERLLCHELPDPPSDVDTTPPGLDPSLTTRERFQRHTNDARCASCHSFIDGIGFGLERYDGVGDWRATENGRAIDDSGTLKGPEGFQDASAPAFHGARELAQLVAPTDSAKACVVRQYYRYGRGYSESEADACVLGELAAQFRDGGLDLQEMLVQFVMQDSFVLRRAE